MSSPNVRVAQNISLQNHLKLLFKEEFLEDIEELFDEAQSTGDTTDN